MILNSCRRSAFVCLCLCITPVVDHEIIVTIFDHTVTLQHKVILDFACVFRSSYSDVGAGVEITCVCVCALLIGREMVQAWECCPLVEKQTSLSSLLSLSLSLPLHARQERYDGDGKSNSKMKGRRKKCEEMRKRGKGNHCSVSL